MSQFQIRKDDFLTQRLVPLEADTVASLLAPGQINTRLPTVIVDMSGNSALLKQLALLLGENLNYSIRVGLTHWAKSQGDAGLDESKSEFFFAPTYIQKRMKDWGPQGFAERRERFMHASAAWFPTFTLSHRRWEPFSRKANCFTY